MDVSNLESHFNPGLVKEAMRTPSKRLQSAVQR
jgi:hypothetical protein